MCFCVSEQSDFHSCTSVCSVFVFLVRTLSSLTDWASDESQNLFHCSMKFSKQRVVGEDVSPWRTRTRIHTAHFHGASVVSLTDAVPSLFGQVSITWKQQPDRAPAAAYVAPSQCRGPSLSSVRRQRNHSRAACAEMRLNGHTSRIDTVEWELQMGTSCLIFPPKHWIGADIFDAFRCDSVFEKQTKGTVQMTPLAQGCICCRKSSWGIQRIPWPST